MKEKSLKVNFFFWFEGHIKKRVVSPPEVFQKVMREVGFF